MSLGQSITRKGLVQIAILSLFMVAGGLGLLRYAGAFPSLRQVLILGMAGFGVIVGLLICSLILLGKYSNLEISESLGSALPVPRWSRVGNFAAYLYGLLSISLGIFFIYHGVVKNDKIDVAVGLIPLFLGASLVVAFLSVRNK